MNDADLCDLVILSNRCLNKALHTDMSGEGTRENFRQMESNRLVGGVEHTSGGPDEQSEPGERQYGHDREAPGLGAPLRSGSSVPEIAKGLQYTPFAGEATRAFIENAMPGMGRLSRAIERWVRPFHRRSTDWSSDWNYVKGLSVTAVMERVETQQTMALLALRLSARVLHVNSSFVAILSFRVIRLRCNGNANI